MDASLGRAVNYVEEAEAASRREAKQGIASSSRKKRKTPQLYFRPWQRIATACANRPLQSVTPEHRVALEMAVTEDIEQRELSRYAKSIGAAWQDEEEIASIADGLHVPAHVEERLAQLKRARSSGRAS
jgi:hypothetical protein